MNQCFSPRGEGVRAERLLLVVATIALSAFVKLFETNLGLQPAPRPREIALAPRRLIVAQRDGTRLLLNAGEARLHHRTHTRMHNAFRPTQPSPHTPGAHPHTAGYHRHTDARIPLPPLCYPGIL